MNDATCGAFWFDFHCITCLNHSRRIVFAICSSLPLGWSSVSLIALCERLHVGIVDCFSGAGSFSVLRVYWTRGRSDPSRGGIL